MSAFADDGALRAAVAGAKSRKQVLARLGVTPATSNYERLTRSAERLGLELPALGRHFRTRARSGALADDLRLKALVEEGLNLGEILMAVGLAQSPSNRHRLAGRLAELGLAARQTVHRQRNPLDNFARITGVEPGRLTRSAAHTNATGDAAELAAAACLRRLGATVSFPVGYACRYDLIVDVAGALFRGQVKSGHIESGCIVANGMSSNTNRPRRPYDPQDVDVILVYCPALGSVYWLPVSDLNGATRVRLRVDEPANSQRSRIRSAFDYYIGQV